MFIRILTLPIAYALMAAGAQALDLTGTWHLSGLGLPADLAQNVDGDGIVIGLTGNNTFDANDGSMTIGPTGEVSGFIGGAITGTASVDSSGVATLSLTSPDSMTLTFHVSANSDLMVNSHSEPSYHELLIMTKAPGNALLADAVGTWWVLEMETPSAISLQYNGDAKATGINNPNSFRQSRAALVIDSEGHYNYNSGEELGSVIVAADGTMTITPDNPLMTGLQLHMNALKDVMISASANADSRNLTVLVKSHEVHNWEATGHWAMHSATLPGSLTMSLNANNLVTHIDGFNFLGQVNGSIDFTINGSLTGYHEGPFSGSSAGSTDGLILINHGEPTPLAGAINIGGDFFVAVQASDGSNDLMMLLAVRSLRPLAIGVLPTSPTKIAWVPGEGRVLQESSNFTNWQTVSGSGTTSFHEPNLASSGPSHYYRLWQP